MKDVATTPSACTFPLSLLSGSSEQDALVRIVQKLRAHAARPSSAVSFQAVLDHLEQKLEGLKKREDTLIALTDHYRDLYEHIPCMYFTIDEKGRILSVNAFGAEYLGYTVQELVGHSVLTIIHEGDHSVVEKHLQTCLKSKSKICHWEFRKVKRDGGVIWVRESARVLVDQVGEKTIMVVCEDITQRKLAEEEIQSLNEDLEQRVAERTSELEALNIQLMNSEARYRAVVEDQTELICRFLPDRTLTFANEAYCRYFDKTRKELIGQRFMEMLPKEDLQRLNEHLASLTKEHPTAVITHRRVATPHGRLRWQQWTDRAIFDNSGVLVEYQSVGNDITERKEAEEELRNSRERLRAFSARLQSAKEEEARRISREIHDKLGQALTGLKMDISWLQRKITKLSAARSANNIQDRMTSMCREIDETVQTVRRISTELRPGVLDDVGLVGALEWQAQEFKNRTGVRFTLSANKKELQLDSNLATAVFRIFQEILTNITRHARASDIQVSLNSRESELVLQVSDNGIGILKKDFARIGALGIVGMRERAQLFGGRVELQGVSGKGTTVSVTFPLAQPKE